MKKIHEAIQAINPSTNVALKCSEVNSDNIDNITFEWNGDTPISKTDIQAKMTELETAKANEQAQKEADALAGNNKLLELGLTQAEATALTGYTPPTEV
jgi:hypothetical protein